ncbi:hypothetical protein D9613_007260 [Agrocybe pediades]|uniref:BTB domain-containing protein n=1 Tax=Agrocybe pediades TaxID=84607 RepID=A0A8H4QI16_9AGAR|nr:hypothetical protein D9613_007260 [Agrocybe pediades]
MTLLHDYYNTRNLQGFQRLLDGSNDRGSTASAPSAASISGSAGGGGKSWNRTGGLASNIGAQIDVNARDWLGRTVLHLASTSLEAIEYVRALLKHPNIDVNLADIENMWTPLHRAMYSANFPVALLLLQRSDIDASLKDIEGYTPYDLYNSTVNGTKPMGQNETAELFTWGANRNAALGLSDGNDRIYPDHVVIKPKEESEDLSKATLAARFSLILVKQIQMSRLHTAIVTTETEGNLRLCGFGSGGRLGPAQHTQYSLKPLPSFNLPVARVALGQDHTLVLTTSGEVYSWGLNRFSQLGYIVELSTTASGRNEEPIQSVPKRVVGLLRREVVIGVAASKNASACWTKETVFTWGTNTGQLGYDKNAQPVQLTPRPVTKFSNAVIDLAMSDTVLVGLLVTNHVECIWNDRQTRISFPVHAFPTGIEPYRPPQSIKDSCISKVVCCDETFAALSSNGEVFTFSAPNAGADGTGDGKGFRPQRVWALRKKFSAVKDVALGSDGSLIVCTESGHVFVRTRNAKNASAKAFKFERVPFLQRITQVCANSTGAFGALKVNYTPRSIQVTGNSIAQDLKTVQPYLRFYREPESDDPRLKFDNGKSGANSAKGKRKLTFSSPDIDPYDDEPEDAGIESDINDLIELCHVLVYEQTMRKAGGGNVNYDGVRLPHGADTMIHVQSRAAFPAHRVVLGARSAVFAKLLSGSQPVGNAQSNLSIRVLSAKPGPGLGVFRTTRLEVLGCHPLTVLILLQYLYSDNVLAIWDRRVNVAAETELRAVGVNPAQIKTELQGFAQLLGLTELKAALEPPVKREVAPSMVRDFRKLFDSVSQHPPLPRTSPLAPDVVLVLADNKEVYCHSVVLRARSPLFASFFDLEDWTARRWDADGMIRVNMRHLGWHVMRFVLGFMCCGEDAEMFYVLDFVKSVEDILQFMFDVLAAANELLLDRLVLLCSAVILAHSNITNACYILADATHYHVLPLIEKMQEYITVNMESFLESHLLDEIPYALVKQLAKFVKERQIEKSPYSRGQAHLNAVMEKNADWLAIQDIPETITSSTSRYSANFMRKDGSNAKLSPPTPMRKVSRKASGVTLTKAASAAAINVASSPSLRRPPSGDDIFLMDEHDAPAASSSNQETGATFSVTSPPVWKAHPAAPKVDMKALMAEAAKSQASPSRPPLNAAAPSYSPMRSSAAGGSNPMTTPTKSAGKSGPPLGWRVHPDPADRSPVPPTPPTAAVAASSSSNAMSGISLSRENNAKAPAGTPSKAQFPALQTPSAQPTTPARPQAPGLGPVITPSRVMPSKSGSRVPSGGKVWNQPPVNPTPPAASATPTKGMSFIAIQHAQQEQAAPVKDKRTLREIQEEEASLQAEADFLKWWTAEEQRIQQEEMLLMAQLQNGGGSGQNNRNASSSSNRKPKAPRHKQQPKKDKAPGPGPGGNAAPAAAAGGPSEPTSTAPSLRGQSSSNQQQPHNNNNNKPRRPQQPRKPRPNTKTEADSMKA